MADSEKNQKIKLIIASIAFVIGGILLAINFGLINLSPKVEPGTAEVGTNAPLVNEPKLTEEEKLEKEADEAAIREETKNRPASGS